MKIAVVVPCVNEKPYIAECIHAIFANRFEQAVEISVFIVDGMSDDGTREVVTGLKSQYPELYLVDNPIRFTPFAFNIGITSIEADYYQIVGARHILSDNYLQKSLSILDRDKSIWCVGGRIINNYINHTGEIIANAMSTTFGMGIGNFRTLSKSGFTDTVTSPMYPAWVFRKIGYFDEALVRNQDDDFNFRVTKAGGKIYYEHDIYLKYYVRGNFRNLYKQFFQYGYWKVYVNKKHKSVTTIRQLAPPLFVLFFFVSALLTLAGSFLAPLCWSILGLYFLLDIGFSLKVSKSAKDFFQTLFIYPLMHFSYGLGYLKGILHFLVFGRIPSDREKKISR